MGWRSDPFEYSRPPLPWRCLFGKHKWTVMSERDTVNLRLLHGSIPPKQCILCGTRK